ncbi:hypothetical protein IWW38_001093 [Coemansia aciculifera]|uniref:Uncharacterized protein n=1 Tax=Coemansia aciculifera TaxID=417176 RepID=A0ACC1M829_9FUNG|nr:hypothetical protein IWW38_001093 [Coemansia aciculifera]
MSSAAVADTRDTIGALILKSIARARAAIIHESPPVYSRGAWAIISDIPYPPPPPYAGSSRHPPTYAEALEIGVVASPLRAEQRMLCIYRQNTSPSMSATHSVHSSNGTVAEQASGDEEALLSGCDYRMTSLEELPDGDEDGESLPDYADIISPVVRRWRLGQAAFEKPPLHPRGFVNNVALPA